MSEIKKVAVIGASGYAGAELVGLLNQHDKVSIQHLVVSENSTSCGKPFSELHGRWQGGYVMYPPCNLFLSNGLKTMLSILQKN